MSLVVSGVIAIGLLGFGGFYLWSAMEKNKAIDDQINQAKADIGRLVAMDPTPNPSNLVVARRELERLNSFIAQARRQFPPTPPSAVPLNNESFKNLLERTIYDLHREAESVGIKVETNYFFSFETWRIPVNFPAESLRPLSERLHEVKVLSSILFKARINRLVSIQRAPVPGERPASQSDYLNRSAQTNSETGMVLWPYEVTFHCFSPELGAVLEALEREPYGFVVRSPSIELAPDERSQSGQPNQPLRQPFNPRAPNRPTNTPPALTTIINEKMLRVTLRLEVIKPEPVPPGGPGVRGPRGGGPGGGR